MAEKKEKLELSNLQVVVIVVAALAILGLSLWKSGIIGGGPRYIEPVVSAQDMQKRLDMANKIVAEVEAAPVAQRGEIAHGYGDKIYCVKNSGDEKLLARWKKAMEEYEALAK
jgi:hypothetical protein